MVASRDAFTMRYGVYLKRPRQRLWRLVLVCDSRDEALEQGRLLGHANDTEHLVYMFLGETPPDVLRSVTDESGAFDPLPLDEH